MTTRYRTALFVSMIVGVFLLTLGADHVYKVGVANADAQVLDAGLGSGSGSGSGSAMIGSASIRLTIDQLPNPIQNPTAAFDEVKAAKKLGWATLVFAVLLMLSKALAYTKESLGKVPLIGKLSTWLADDKHAIWVAGFGSIAAAGYNSLATGGTWMAALFAAAAVLFGLVHPTTQPKQQS